MWNISEPKMLIKQTLELLNNEVKFLEVYKLNVFVIELV